MAHIAVVDDIPANRELLSTVLSAMGHLPLEAADGAAALALVRAQHPDLVICDVLMPVMDGYEFMRHLRAEPAIGDIPVIFYTAHYFEDEARQLALSCGVNGFLPKPCEPQDILRVVQDVLALPRVPLTAPPSGDFDRRHLDLVTDKLSQKVADLEEANRQLAAQHERILRLNRVHAVLSGINAAIVRLHDRRALFQEACRVAVEAGRFGMAWIGEVADDGRTVRPAAWAGMDDSLGAAPVLLEQDRSAGWGAVQQAVAGGQPVITDNLQERRPDEPALTVRQQEALRRGYGSAIVMPLFLEWRVAGVMVLYAREAGFFRDEEMELLAELAGDVSFSLEYIDKQDRLAWMSLHDLLTGLPNRILLLERTSQAIQLARQHDRRVGVAAVDVHRFRNVNESLGRQAGDGLLRDIARRLSQSWPGNGHVGRLGADVFGALVDDAEDFRQVAHELDSALVGTFGRPYRVEDHDIRLAASAGVALYPDDGEDADTLLRNAETALRRAKATNQPHAFYRPEMNARVANLLLLESRLRRAVERSEFVLHYQPKMNLATGKTTSFEALIRWQDPESGLIPPDQFVHVLEETGLMLPVGAWAIRQVLEDGQRWLKNGKAPLRIAVNVSSLQLQQQDFTESIQNALADSHPDGPPWMDIELTESMLMADIELNVPRLSSIRGMGLGIAIDDFGTGYSSLGYLTRLPVNALKIDRSFIVTMMSSPESMTIVSTIITLAHALGMKVIAEGVETEEQARMLRLLKCDEMQGFLLSAAVPPERMPEFLAA